MAIPLLVAAAAAIQTLFFFHRTFFWARRRRPLRAGSAGVTGLLATGVAAVAGLLTVSLISYSRLTAEQVVASIEFRQLSADEFQVRLMIPGEHDRLLRLRGDEWQMDARLINWKPPATLLGMDPIYRLERLSGRYTEIDRERSEQRTVHALSPSQPVDLWQAARRFPLLLPGVDAYYGTATYVPMADGARFEVSLSRDALVARPANDAARRAVGSWGNR